MKIKIISFAQATDLFELLLLKLKNIEEEIGFIEISARIPDIDFTEDVFKNLDVSNKLKTLLIGEKTCHGLGDWAGINEDIIIEKLLQENGEEIRFFLKEELRETDFVFFVQYFVNPNTERIVPYIVEEIKKLNIPIITFLSRNHVGELLSSDGKESLEKIEKGIKCFNEIAEKVKKISDLTFITEDFDTNSLKGKIHFRDLMKIENECVGNKIEKIISYLSNGGNLDDLEIKKILEEKNLLDFEH